MAVFGPGTGLGEATLVPAPYKDGEYRYYSVPSESGHCVYSVDNE